MSDDFDSQPSEEAWSTGPDWSDSDHAGEGIENHSRHSRCLVASACPSTRSMLVRAASDAGWSVIDAADATQALSAVHRERLEMAWVDLRDRSSVLPSNSLTKTSWRDVCEAVAGLPHVLLAVCGQDFEPTEEIWARQLGVWLFVPGISLSDAPDVAALCEEALTVASHCTT